MGGCRDSWSGPWQEPRACNRNVTPAGAGHARTTGATLHLCPPLCVQAGCTMQQAWARCAAQRAFFICWMLARYPCPPLRMASSCGARRLACVAATARPTLLWRPALSTSSRSRLVTLTSRSLRLFVQSVGQMPLDVQEIGCDFLCATGIAAGFLAHGQQVWGWQAGATTVRLCCSGDRHCAPSHVRRLATLMSPAFLQQGESTCVRHAAVACCSAGGEQPEVGLGFASVSLDLHRMLRSEWHRYPCLAIHPVLALSLPTYSMPLPLLSALHAATRSTALSQPLWTTWAHPGPCATSTSCSPQHGALSSTKCPLLPRWAGLQGGPRGRIPGAPPRHACVGCPAGGAGRGPGPHPPPTHTHPHPTHPADLAALQGPILFFPSP